jgi:hypothetical protein
VRYSYQLCVQLYFAFTEYETGTWVRMERTREVMNDVFHDFLALLEQLEDHIYYGNLLIKANKDNFLTAWYLSNLSYIQLFLTIFSEQHCTKAVVDAVRMIADRPAAPRLLPGHRGRFHLFIQWNVGVNGQILPEATS